LPPIPEIGVLRLHAAVQHNAWGGCAISAAVRPIWKHCLIYESFAQALAACAAQFSLARGPSAPSPFPGALSGFELSRELRDHPRHAAEMFFARSATGGPRIFASARLVRKFETPLPGWAARPRVLPIERAVVPLRTARPTGNESGVVVCAAA